MRIRRIIVTEVVIPARPGAVNGPGIDRPLHKLPIGGRPAWSVQFDDVPKVVLAIECEDGTVGYGECYRGHDWHTVRSIARTLLAEDLDDLVLQALPIGRCREHDGFECALWDLSAKRHGLRLVDLLGGPVRERVSVSAWSGHRRTEEIAEVVGRFEGAGHEFVKFKCDADDDVVGWCREVARVAPGMRVILDPNERWVHPFEARRRLGELAAVGNVLCVEDPIARWRLDDYRDLRRESPIAIVLHVALPYFEQGQRVQDALEAISRRAVDGFNFNAGLAAFHGLGQLASAADLPCWHGSEIDLGILEAMYLHSCAAAPACEWPSDVFGRSIRSHDLLKEPLTLDPPYAMLPSGPGLGVEPDPEALRAHGRRQEVFEPE